MTDEMIDDIDRPRKKKKKRVYNRATGQFQEPATHLDAKKWWSKKLGLGGSAGEGALAKRRKKVVDDNIEAGGG